MSENSGNLLLNGEMTPEKAMTFLDQAQTYFERRPTGGEDSAHWANVYNAEWCKQITAFIAHEDIKVKSSQARLSEAVKVLEEMLKWLKYLPAPYPDDSEMIMALTAKAKDFLATLGEENE